MTKKAIILETVAYYKTHVRSINKDLQTCLYDGPRGARCAFSRCCTIKGVEALKRCNDTPADFLPKPVDSYLLAKYKGHNKDFWAEVQQIHDMNSHWDNKKLTKAGQEYVDALINEYAKN